MINSNTDVIFYCRSHDAYLLYCHSIEIAPSELNGLYTLETLVISEDTGDFVETGERGDVEGWFMLGLEATNGNARNCLERIRRWELRSGQF